MRKLAIPVVALAAAVPGAAAIAGDSAPRITAKSAGQVKLGALHSKLREAGALGPKRPGCELAGPQRRSAKLKSPLVGSVELTDASPRRVDTIVIRGGDANARGVKVGSPIATIESAFANVKVDRSTEETFLLTLYRVPKASGGRITFGVSTKTKKVQLIGIPSIPFCD